MTEAIINLQALLVKSYHHRKAFPVGYHSAQVLRPASRYSARLNAVRRDSLLWVRGGSKLSFSACPIRAHEGTVTTIDNSRLCERR